MALEEKGMALGKRGMAQRHAKRDWGKHYIHKSQIALLNMYCHYSATINYNFIPRKVSFSVFMSL